MKLAQLKFIGMAILATCLSAGGVVAVSYAANQNPKEAGSADGPGVSADKPDTQNVPTTLGTLIKVSSSTEKRLVALEAKLDELLSRSSPKSARAANTTSDPIDPFRRDPALSKHDDNARAMVDSQHRSIPELEVELDMAVANDAGTQKLFEQHVISTAEREIARRKVLLVKAMLEGLDDELSDEIDRLKLEIKTKLAERERANAQNEAATTVVARNTRLNERRPGMVSSEDVAKADWELKAAAAQVAIAEAESKEIALRVQQLQRRRTRIREIIKKANA